jgi:hypothetical protein
MTSKLRSSSTAVKLLAIASFAFSTLLTSPAFALTEEKVQEVLASVPVFMLTDSKGNPVTVSRKVDDKNTFTLTYAFFSSKDATTALESVKKSNAKLGGEAAIRAIPLSEAYKVRTQIRKEKNSDLLFIGDSLQKDPYISLLQSQGAKAEDIKKLKEMDVVVPVFISNVSVKGKDKAGKEITIVPAFLDYQQANAFVDQAKKTYKDAKLTTVPLELFLDSIKKMDSKGEQIELVPSKASIDFVKSNQVQTRK